MAEWFKAFETERSEVSRNFTPNHSVAWILSECERALRGDVSDRAADTFGDTTVRTLIEMWRDPSRRNSAVWMAFEKTSQSSQEITAAGFEFLGRNAALSGVRAHNR
jgi:hypothetical protein